MYDSFKVVKVCTISVTNTKLLLLILWFTGKINKKMTNLEQAFRKSFQKNIYDCHNDAILRWQMHVVIMLTY